MSFFDQPYYRLNKLFLCLFGIWPEQSLLARCLIPSLHILIIMSITVFEARRAIDVWRSPIQLLNCLPPFLVHGVAFAKLLNGSINVGKYRALLNMIQNHWTRMNHSPNIEILHECGERARSFTIFYSVFIFGMMSTYLALPLLPVIFDIVAPLNESRPRKFLFEVEFGIDQDKYFYHIFCHASMTAIDAIAILVTVDTMYFTIVGHACGLFQMVGANMTMSRKSFDNSFDDDNKRISYCVDLHTEALIFSNIIESTYTVSFVIVLVGSLIGMTVSALQLLLNIDDPDDVVRFGAFMAGQVIHLFFNSLPGQKIIDYSLGVRDSIYESDWNDFHVKNQKLVLMILMRSQEPFLLTAGKLHALSIASFSSVMQTSVSYFTVLRSML